MHGQPNAYGVYTSEREQMISNFETFVIMMVLGYTLKHLKDQPSDQFVDEGVCTYFIIFDMIVTFLYKPFIYLGLVVKLDGEITMNLYTLFQIQ